MDWRNRRRFDLRRNVGPSHARTEVLGCRRRLCPPQLPDARRHLSQANETPDDVRVLIARGVLPRPSYVLDDGTEMFPADYFLLPDEAGGPEHLRSHFSERYLVAGGPAEELESQWNGYVSGTYGVCLREVVPETIVRKSALVDSLTDVVGAPRPDDEAWRRELRRQVDELDELEREFSPDYDRGDRFDEPPSRDRLIAAARERYPGAVRTRAGGRTRLTIGSRSK
jgi:Family of unknown function (DUF6058)